MQSDWQAVVGCRAGLLAMVAIELFGAASAVGQSEWRLRQTLHSGDPQLEELFGAATAMDGEFALIGAPGDDTRNDRSGALFAYRSDGLAWREEQKIVPDDLGQLDAFGEQVDMSGNWAIVGVLHDDTYGINSGAVYTLRREQDEWRVTQKLYGWRTAERIDFGYRVAIEGDIAAVTDMPEQRRNGSVTIFRYDGEAWRQEAIFEGRVVSSFFGESVAISDGFVYVGSPKSYGRVSRAGAVHVFRHDGNDWTWSGKIFASDGDIDRVFGTSVDADGPVVVVGDRAHTDYNGAAYIFRWNGRSWIEEARLLGDSESRGRFGERVAVSRDLVAVTAPDEHGLADHSGAVYIYRHDGESWMQEARLHNSFPYDRGEFGSDVAVAGGQILIGDQWDDELASSAGATFQYRLETLHVSPPWPGLAGMNNTWRVTGAHADEVVHVAAGLAPGPSSREICPGVYLDIRRPVQLFAARADTRGTAEASFFVPNFLAGLVVRYQAVGRDNCRLSETVVHRLQRR